MFSTAKILLRNGGSQLFLRELPTKSAFCCGSFFPLAILIFNKFRQSLFPPSCRSSIRLFKKCPPITSDAKQFFVDYTFDLGLKILYESPKDIGADRLVDAFAAVEKYGKPCIVCDFGTATTIDVVNERSEYLGGIITPGLSVLADTLFQKTSKLPKVEVKKPEKVIGNSTVTSIQSGIYHGYIGLVDGILQKMINELGEKPQIIATGGLAALIAENSDLITIVDETLMLEGLRLIYKKTSLLR